MRLIVPLLVSLLCPAGLWAGAVNGKITCRGLGDHSNAVIYAEKIPKEPVPPPKDRAVMDQLNKTFIPHVLPVVTGATVDFPNSDPVRHNVFSRSPAKRFNLGTYPKGVTKQVAFDKPGEVALLCNVHAEMSAYVLAVETPYYTVSAKDGSYSLKNLPPGKFTVTAWHERFQPVSNPVEIKGTESVPLNFELTRRR